MDRDTLLSIKDNVITQTDWHYRSTTISNTFHEEPLGTDGCTAALGEALSLPLRTTEGTAGTCFVSYDPAKCFEPRGTLEVAKRVMEAGFAKNVRFSMAAFLLEDSSAVDVFSNKPMELPKVVNGALEGATTKEVATWAAAARLIDDVHKMPRSEDTSTCIHFMKGNDRASSFYVVAIPTGKKDFAHGFADAAFATCITMAAKRKSAIPFERSLLTQMLAEVFVSGSTAMCTFLSPSRDKADPVLGYACDCGAMAPIYPCLINVSEDGKEDSKVRIFLDSDSAEMIGVVRSKVAVKCGLPEGRVRLEHSRTGECLTDSNMLAPVATARAGSAALSVQIRVLPVLQQGWWVEVLEDAGEGPSVRAAQITDVDGGYVVSVEKASHGFKPEELCIAPINTHKARPDLPFSFHRSDGQTGLGLEQYLTENGHVAAPIGCFVSDTAEDFFPTPTP